MTFKLINAAPSIDVLKTILTDTAVMGAYLAIEFGTKETPPVITMYDRTFLASEGMIARDMFNDDWLVMLQLGRGSAAYTIASVIVSNTSLFAEEFEEIFKHPAITIKTVREIFSEIDTSQCLGTHSSECTIPTSFLEITAVKADNFVGSWYYTEEYQKNVKNGEGEIHLGIDAVKDPRDKKI